jgi:hypothetical protein
VTRKFRESLCGAHGTPYLDAAGAERVKPFHYDVTAVELVDPLPLAVLQAGFDGFLAERLADGSTRAERRVRDVFHTCPAESLPLILAHGMRPSHCEYCRGVVDEPECGDQGFFGDHTKGVYLSKHADYTFWYQRKRDVQVGDTGRVIMLEVATGLVQHFGQKRDGAPPTPNFHCHESPNHLEFFVWDNETQAEPPRPSCRAIPKYIVSWRAVANNRAHIKHEV